MVKMKIIVKEGLNDNEYYTKVANDIADYVVKELKLSFGNVEFRLVNNDEFAKSIALHENPFPTWYTGQTYLATKERMNARYEVLYEMVGHKYKNTLENEDYTVVYINKSDSEEEIRSVIAHVYGHMHMNYNNYVCKNLSADLVKYGAYRERYAELETIISDNGKVNGKKKLEEIFDMAQTLETLRDFYSETRSTLDQELKDYYKINNVLPDKTEYDVYKFLIQNAKLNPWEKEVYEMMYDVAQIYKKARVKIMHEGFASFVEKKYALYGEKDPVMAAKMQLSLDDVANPYYRPQLPYALGLRLFENIEERGNKGRFGVHYELLSEEKKKEYDDKSGKGIEKILDSIRFLDDIDFIEAYADDFFLKNYITILKDRFPEDHIPRTREEFQYMQWVSELEPRTLRLELILGIEHYFPKLQILKGEANYNGQMGPGLMLDQDLSYIQRHVDFGELTKEETDSMWQGLTLLNHNTANSLVRLSKMWGKPVYIRTVDPSGAPCIIGSDSVKVRIFLLKSSPNGVSMFG